MKTEHLGGPEDGTVTIRIEGLENDVKLLHLTDSHMVEGDDRDPEAHAHVERYREVFGEKSGGRLTSEIFRETVREVSTLGLQGAMLTGDMIHFPSQAALEELQSGVEQLGLPFLYTLGNHDWFFPHLEWTGETRRQYYPRFDSLCGGDPSFQVVEVGGVRLIGMDNSNYQVSSDQVFQLKQELATGKPSLLLIHVPLCLEDIFDAIMERWKAPIVMGAEKGWTPETREKWMMPRNEESTLECLDFLTNGQCDNLVGVFCGHVHFPSVTRVREGCLQYVGAPGFDGKYRIVELKPF